MDSNAKNLAELLNKILQLQSQILQMVQSQLRNCQYRCSNTAKIADDAVSSAKLFATNLGRW